MAYKIPEKLRSLEIYDPVTEEYDVRLDANESYLNVPEEIRNDIMDAIRKVEFNRYPDPLARELRKKAGAFFHVKPELLTAGNGSDELISLIVPNFLDRGDTMLVAVPDFSMYWFYAQFNDIIEVFKSYNFPLSVSGITIDRVIEVSKNDKKMDGGKIKFILLSEMGNAYIDRDVTDNDMAEALVGIID